MAVDYRTADAMYTDTDAKYRAFVQGIENAFLGTGAMVLATATGMLDPATVTNPGSGATAGYRVYRFDDADQATSPIFLRVDYWCDYPGTYPRMILQVGTAITAAGAITGARVSTQLNTSTGNTSGMPSGLLRHFWSSGEPGRIAVATGDPTSDRTPWTFVIERLCKLDGTPTDDGVFYMFTYGNAGDPRCLMGVIPHTRYGVNVLEYPFSSSQAWAQPNPGATLSRSASGAFVCVFPYLIALAPDWLGVRSFLGATASAGLLPGTPVRASWSGDDHDYMPLSVNITGTVFMDSVGTGMILWE
jgi:hypothetical protein